MFKFFTFVLLVLLIISYLPSSVDQDQIKCEVQKQLNACVNGWNAGDIDQYMSVYLNSDSLRFASNNSYQYGWQPVCNGYKDKYNTPEKMGTLIFSEIEITVISEEAAAVFGRFTLKREKDEPTGLFTLLFKKFDNGWKIVSDHTSV